MSEAPSRISVSEDKLRLALSEFKNDLMKELQAFATVAALDHLEEKVDSLALWKAAQEARAENQRFVSDRALAWGAILVALMGAITTIFWLYHG